MSNHTQTLAAHSSALKHARYLAEQIGPRGSTTPQEAQAADYAHQAMAEASLQPVKETFRSPRSGWLPYALALGLTIAAELLFLLAPGLVGGGLATALMIIALGLIYLELTFEDNPLRWLLPKAASQNVWARLPAAGEVRQRVLLIGHLDTHRTPRLASSVTWLQLYQLLIPVGLAASLANTLFYFISLLDDWGGWRSLSVLPALVLWWIFVLVLEPEFTSYTAGANDNATGAGTVLSLAGLLKANPLPGTEVWALCSGCEEVGGYGATAFFASHKDELLPGGDKDKARSAYCITLDSIGAAGTTPTYLAQETFLTTAKADPELLRLADELAARRPELNARRTSINSAYTEGRLATQAGLRNLSFVNVRKDGLLPHWHQPTDLFANVDGLVVQNTEEFVWELLWALDGGQPGSPLPTAEAVASGQTAPEGNEPVGSALLQSVVEEDQTPESVAPGDVQPEEEEGG